MLTHSLLQRTPSCHLRRRWKLGDKGWRLTSLSGRPNISLLLRQHRSLSNTKIGENTANHLAFVTPCCHSYDGVPFLMHDRTLRRTTNVQDVFPNRTDALAAMFTWAELEVLNAGSWFLLVRECYFCFCVYFDSCPLCSVI